MQNTYRPINFIPIWFFQAFDTELDGMAILEFKNMF